MKKLSIFACTLAMVGMVFTSCKKGGEDLDNVIEDGFYCVGPATPVASIEASNLRDALMGAGTNEVTKKQRDGMYEKYIYLEANKDFSLVLHEEGAEDVVYGANLEEGMAITDNPTEEIKQFKGLLKENLKMQVKEAGLYHIILDLDKLGDLASQGGAQIILVPCNWGMRGWKGDWGFTEMKIVEQSATKIVYKYAPAVPDTLEATGSFKFAHSNCWKFQLDMGGQVKAENSIGTNATEDGGAYSELLNGGKNIPVKRGIYDYVTLTWELKGGKVCDCFTFETHKCGSLVVADPAEFVAGVSGSGLFGESGNIPAWADPVNEALAVYDADASVVKNQETKAGTYVYNISNLNFEAGSQVKFRYNGAWLGINDVDVIGVTTSGSDNIEGVVGAYNIKITVEWAGDDADEMAASSIKAEFSAGTPAIKPIYDYVSGKIFLKNDGTLTNLHIYGYATDKDNNTDIFGAWPGFSIGSDAKELTQIFYEKAIKDATYKFIINNGNGGDGNQTADTEWSVVITGENTISLLINDQNQLVLGN